MEKINYLDLFVKMAQADISYWEYYIKMEKESDETEDPDWDWDMMNDVKFVRRYERKRAFEEVREELELQEEWDIFALAVADSQLSYIENSGKFSEGTVKYGREREWIDLGLQKMLWRIVPDVFEKDWGWEKLKSEFEWQNEVCKRQAETIHSDHEMNRELSQSYLTKEEAEKHLENPMEYSCNECGATFYAKYRSKYCQGATCPVCGTREW